jgi:hypothetical protein
VNKFGPTSPNISPNIDSPPHLDQQLSGVAKDLPCR